MFENFHHVFLKCLENFEIIPCFREGLKTMWNSTANIQTAHMFEAQDYDVVEDKLKDMKS
jgi:hypothetical protein